MIPLVAFNSTWQRDNSTHAFSLFLSSSLHLASSSLIRFSRFPLCISDSDSTESVRAANPLNPPCNFAAEPNKLCV